jgi:hypothetical protein
MDRCSNSCGKSPRRESKKKEDQSACKSRKVAKHSVCFQMFCGSGRTKSRLAKAAGVEIPEKDMPEKREKA